MQVVSRGVVDAELAVVAAAVLVGGVLVDGVLVDGMLVDGVLVGAVVADAELGGAVVEEATADPSDEPLAELEPVHADTTTSTAADSTTAEQRVRRFETDENVVMTNTPDVTRPTSEIVTTSLPAACHQCPRGNLRRLSASQLHIATGSQLSARDAAAVVRHSIPGSHCGFLPANAAGTSVRNRPRSCAAPPHPVDVQRVGTVLLGPSVATRHLWCPREDSNLRPAV